MNRLLLVPTLVVFLAPHARPQAQAAHDSSAPAPYLRQLGALHYPGGEAAQPDRVRAIRALADGAVVVCGSTEGSLGEPSAGGSDVFVARFAPNGDLDWIAQIGAVTAPTIPALNGDAFGPGGDAGGSDLANDLAIAPDGSILVVGATSSSLGETNAGTLDLFVAKLDAGGDLLWLRQLGLETAPTIEPAAGATRYGSAASYDLGSSIVLHANGELTVAGATASDLSEQCSETIDFFVARFDGSGGLLWLRQMGQTSAPLIGYNPDLDEFASGIAELPSGDLVLIGTSTWFLGASFGESGIVMTFDATGQPLDWTAHPSAGYESLAVDAATGSLFVAGYHLIADEYTSTKDALLVRYEADLEFQWSRRFDAASTSHLDLLDLSQTDECIGVALDAWGQPVLVGQTQGSLNEPNAGGWGWDLFTAKVRAQDGRVLWVSQLGEKTAAELGVDASGHETGGGRPFSIGPNRELLVGASTTGSLGEPNAGGADALVLRLDARGGL